ncbi:hypothetical protein PAXINDRAFT_35395, partial [Paxillus involutus ATCC 200175]
SARTTRLIKWCKENKSARIRLFSDSTQDAKDAGRKKEVSDVSKKDYYWGIPDTARQWTREEVLRYSCMRQDGRACYMSLLCKKYNEVNSKLGQTGAGMSYEDLVADPSKSNIIQKLVESFPWWPELHGWWRKNPAYNTAYCVADSGQNLAAEALLM